MAWPTFQPHAQGPEVAIQSLSRNGLLTWTNASLNVTCRVEWAASAQGPWSSSWESLTNITITNLVTTKAVPMFYRVVCSPPPPWRTNVTAQTALSLVQANAGDPSFAILDVRTPGEYGGRHLKAAVNVDFYSSTFEASLALLDRNRTYLVYCASGNRSGQAASVMQRLSFLRIYNMTQGFSTFAGLPGAAAWLEP